MKFWDSSAIVPLLLEEERSAAVGAEYRRDPEVVAWWGTSIECASAIARRERDGVIDGATTVAAIERLDALGAAWLEMQPSAPIQRTAIRLLRVHPLRAGDALQLAAALIAAEGDASSLAFVTLDDRLAEAAAREGFRIADMPRA
ncbi:MAG: type II toxin-antitoxin system VapC family toxin [Candidatus Limnocylindrales bacterium]